MCRKLKFEVNKVSAVKTQEFSLKMWEILTKYRAGGGEGEERYTFIGKIISIFQPAVTSTRPGNIQWLDSALRWGEKERKCVFWHT